MKRSLAHRSRSITVHPAGSAIRDSVRIICYEDVDAWILGKFARRLDEELNRGGYASSIAKVGDTSALVGHHIIYIDACEKWSPVETVMVTHLDEAWKEKWLVKMMGSFDMAICMSQETARQVEQIGVDPRKVTYVSPAHDGLIQPRRRVIGVAGKTHVDGRRDPKFIVDMMRGVDPKQIELSIMGNGWDIQVADLRSKGFVVNYRPSFDFDAYVTEFMPSLDYFVHYSWDEGSMAFLDAIAADARTLVNRQGFHLDVPNGIDEPIVSAEDVARILRRDLLERCQRVSRVESFTWFEYAFRHRVIWDFLSLEFRKNRADAAGELMPNLRELYGSMATTGELEAHISSRLSESERGSADIELAQVIRLSLIRYPENVGFRQLVGDLYEE
jgi:hypothetical protein